ncbi:interferon-induced very large GTPase 1-like [Dendronephthya gigantea]|uniref:interferon-induced very large GTPase 1-like n=1 Tax=Dendronephthya gigantea TaxID=151771 RepID=UPI00106A2627|nr:interferon-induced very large GTPase 1-like [Dendronephthya gigantea]
MAAMGKGILMAAVFEGQHVCATCSRSISGVFQFIIHADKVTSTVIAGTVVTLSGIYAIYQYKSRQLKLTMKGAIDKGLGGEREDQEVSDILPGKLHVALQCFTGKRFLEVLNDFKSGRIKERLEKEFLDIGIETEELVVEIRNIEEVEERAAAIVTSTMEKSEDENLRKKPRECAKCVHAKNSGKPENIDSENYSSISEFEVPRNGDNGKVHKKKNVQRDPEHSLSTEYLEIGHTSDSKSVETINIPGQEGLLASTAQVDQPEQTCQSNNTITAATAHAPEITNTQDANTSNTLSQSSTDSNLRPHRKYSLKHARKIDNHTLMDDQLTSSDHIPEYIFSKLMIADYTLRELKLKSLNSNEDNARNSYNSDDDEDVDDEDIVAVNSMDALIGTFHCSDNSLRRYLANRMSTCQLSVPFLVPDLAAPTENVTMFLSALESITKSWKTGSNENKSVYEVFATEHPFPIVSFIRIGEIAKSKSFLINKIMSDGSNHHDFFFHREMKGGDVERKVIGGLVELSWYLPSSGQGQKLQNEICFLNLRGDARDFEKQLNFLLKISSVLCVLTSQCPDETTMAVLNKATQSEVVKIYLIFPEATQKQKQAQTKNYFKDLKSKHSDKLSLVMNDSKFNDHKLLDKIRAAIQKAIQGVKAVPLVNLALVAGGHGISLDYDQSDPNFWKTVDSWLQMGIKEAKTLMKLQTHIPELAKLDRELHRPKSSRNDEVFQKIEECEKAKIASFSDLDERFFTVLI